MIQRPIIKLATVFTLIAMSISNATQAIADELDAFIGHWETSDYNCEVPADKRNRGSYLVVTRSEKPNAIGEVNQGDHETEGGSCLLNNPQKLERRTVFDAMCRVEESDPSPTQIELSLVYDDKHLSVLDKQFGGVQFYSLCNRATENWLDGSKEKFTQTGALNPPNPFWWLPETYCRKMFADNAEYVLSGQCAKTVEKCMGEGEEGDCPAYRQCQYWKKGELKSDALCGQTFQLSANKNVSTWVWQNENVVSITTNATSGKIYWGKKEAQNSSLSGGAECYTLNASSEKFCILPYVAQ